MDARILSVAFCSGSFMMFLSVCAASREASRNSSCNALMDSWRSRSSSVAKLGSFVHFHTVSRRSPIFLAAVGMLSPDRIRARAFWCFSESMGQHSTFENVAAILGLFYDMSSRGTRSGGYPHPQTHLAWSVHRAHTHTGNITTRLRCCARLSTTTLRVPSTGHWSKIRGVLGGASPDRARPAPYPVRYAVGP